MSKLWRSIEVVCIVCGREVIKSNKQETCSMKCRDILKQQRRLEKAPEAECPCCKKTAKLLWKTRDIQVCSKRCRSVLTSRYNRSRADWDSSKYQELHTRADTAVCEMCDEEYKPQRYDQRFCSLLCGDRWHIKFGVKGRNQKAKVNATRERLNVAVNTCVLCGTSHNQIIPPNELGMHWRSGKAKFHVDHIIPKGNGGNDTTDNLRYVCWFCNFARQNLDSQYDTAIAAAGRAFWNEMIQLTINKESKP